MLGLPKELYTPIFAISRISGWSAHRIEELVNEGKIIRPAYKYVGHHRPYVAIERRTPERLPTVFQITKKLCEKDTCPVPFWYRAGVLLLPSDLSKNPRSVLLMVINKTLRYTRIFVPLVSRFASLIFAVREISLS